MSKKSRMGSIRLQHAQEDENERTVGAGLAWYRKKQTLMGFIRVRHHDATITSTRHEQIFQIDESAESIPSPRTIIRAPGRASLV
jgi:hypothetical protein